MYIYIIIIIILLDYVGCFVNDRDNREFTIYPGFINSATLTPFLCIQACSANGYAYAAIDTARYCFCKADLTIHSLRDTDGKCQVYNCPGDSSYYCGSDKNILVYVAGVVVKVRLFPHHIFYLY